MAKSTAELQIVEVEATTEPDSYKTETAFLKLLGQAHRQYALQKMRDERKRLGGEGQRQ